MGKGSDGTPVRPSFMKKTFPSMEKLNLENMRNDLTVLKNIWFSKAGGGDHAARLESFYGPQAHACKSLHSYANFRRPRALCKYWREIRPHTDGQNSPHIAFPQTTTFASHFYGEGLHCSLLALLDCPGEAT